MARASKRMAIVSRLKARFVKNDGYFVFCIKYGGYGLKTALYKKILF